MNRLDFMCGGYVVWMCWQIFRAGSFKCCCYFLCCSVLPCLAGVYSVQVSSSDLRGNPSLTVDLAGHALHVFVNGKFSGSGYGTREDRKFTFKEPVSLRAGTNRIALLSVAVGLPNVGPHYETWNTGVLGPVVSEGLGSGKKDLTWQEWSYQVGLKGKYMKLTSPNEAIPDIQFTLYCAFKETSTLRRRNILMQ